MSNPIYWPELVYRRVWYIWRLWLANRAYDFGCKSDIGWLRYWGLKTIVEICDHARSRLVRILKETENERLM